MGASKRLCEMVIQAFDAKIKCRKSLRNPTVVLPTELKEVITSPEIVEALKTTQTEFVAVRFGNDTGKQRLGHPPLQKSR